MLNEYYFDEMMPAYQILNEIELGKLKLYGCLELYGCLVLILISKKAREVFELSAGDKLIIVGDDERGIALVPEKMMSAFFNLVKTTLDKGNEHDDSH